MGNTPAKRRGILLRTVNKNTEHKSISIPFGEEFLNLVYNRSKYTPRFEREIKELMDANLPTGMLAKMVYALLIDWNLEDVKNPEAPEEQWEYEKVPLTPEVFDNLFSGDALVLIVEAISEDSRPNPKTSDFTNAS